MSRDRVATLVDDILGGPSALADLFDSYAARGGPLEGIG
jgi:hypothetical protein